MARHIITLAFITLALVCVLQTTSAFVDLGAYVEGKLKQTLEEEHVTCSNYKEFCDKRTKETAVSDKSKDVEANEMALTLCKAIVKLFVCDVDLDKPFSLDDEEA